MRTLRRSLDMPLRFFSVDCPQHAWNLRLPKYFSKVDTLRDARKSEIECIEWTRDGCRIIVVHRNGVLKIWRADRMIEEYAFNGSWTWADACPSNSSVFAAVSWDGKLKIVDVNSPASATEYDLKRMHGEKFDKLLYVTWNSKNHVAIMTRGDLVHVVDAGTAEVVAFIQPGVDIYNVIFDSNDRLWLACGGTPGKVLIYEGGQMVRDLVAHSHSVMSLAKVHGTTLVLSGGADALVCLWDSITATCIRTFPESISPVTTVACGAGGTLVAWGSGGSKDGEAVLSIAGIQTGYHYATIPVSSAVTRIKWHPSEMVLAYSMQDANVQIVTFPKKDA